VLRPRPGSQGPRPGDSDRRLCTIAGFYKYAVEEDLLDHSPAAHVRRPRLDYESHATGLDRNELGALLVAAGLGTAAEHALISLLALNGLRVSEVTGANIEALGLHAQATAEDLSYEYSVLRFLAAAGWVVPGPVGEPARLDMIAWQLDHGQKTAGWCDDRTGST
jgi:hypothetical protein